MLERNIWYGTENKIRINGNNYLLKLKTCLFNQTFQKANVAIPE